MREGRSATAEDSEEVSDAEVEGEDFDGCPILRLGGCRHGGRGYIEVRTEIFVINLTHLRVSRIGGPQAHRAPTILGVTQDANGEDRGHGAAGED